MAGNVWEWVEDWYQSTYYAESPYSNPPGPTVGTAKLLRGGSWWEDPPALRTAGRVWFDPTYDSGIYYSFGFRCADDP
jgi:formylglycine-generating enzyme required for sulfatase activity